MDKKNEESVASLPDLAYSEWKERLDVGGKALLAFVGAAYVAGLLILNSHVRAHGLDYMNFLQTQYVLVGILWIFILAVSCMVGASMYHSVMGAWTISFTWKNKVAVFITRLLGSILLVAGIAIAFESQILQRLTGFKLRLFSRDWMFAVIVVIAQAVLVFLLIKLTRGFLSNLKRADDDHHNIKSAVWDDRFYLAANVVSLVFCVSAYATYLFPHLEPSYGGGRSQVVQVIIKEDKRETADLIGFKFLPESRNIGQQEIIFEAQEFFLLKPPEGHGEKVKAIRINKDIVDAIYYISDK